MSSHYLHLVNMGFSYGSNRIFTNVSLSVPRDAVTVLTGKNGSGKTTLCRILSGLQPHYAGSIIIDGNELKDISPQIRARQIAYHKQEPEGNIVGATAQEDLAMWQHQFCGYEQNDDAIAAAAREFGIEKLLHTPTWELSNGQRKRIGLAAMLLHPQRYWLLDEPTTGLDTINQQALLRAIGSLSAAGSGCMIITHDPECFARLADIRLHILDNKIKTL